MIKALYLQKRERKEQRAKRKEQRGKSNRRQTEGNQTYLNCRGAKEEKTA